MQHVVVTGASSGIGASIAREWLRRGARVTLVARRRALLDELAAAVPDRTTVVAADLGDPACAEPLIAQCGTIDVLVNNAGIQIVEPAEYTPWERVESLLRLDLHTPLRLVQAVLPQMLARGSGSIVNVASISYLGNVGQTNYAASKAGVVAMTQTWALELARHQIRCNAVAPGLMETDMTKGMPDKIKDAMLPKIPLRLMGRPDEFAAAVAFLASEESSYMTGHVLNLDVGGSVGGF